MHRPQLQIHQSVVEAGNAVPIQLIAQPIPGLLRRGPQLAPIQEDVALVGVQIERQSSLGNFYGPAQVFETGKRVPEGEYEA